MHIATIVGTRPEIIKLSQVMKQLDKHYKQTLIHTGQNFDYELNEIFFKDLGIRKPDYYLDVAGTHLGESIEILSVSHMSYLNTCVPMRCLFMAILTRVYPLYRLSD